MARTLLSVVMPTHNRTDQLERAARSVLSQEMADLELIIVDDASGADSGAVIDRIAEDPRVRTVRNPESLGPGGARNRGIAVAQGELLGFCDDDDEWLPGAAGILVGHLESNPGLGTVSAWHRVVHRDIGRAVDYRGPRHFGADELLWFNFVALPFAIIRRSHFPDGVSFDPTLPTCEDWDVWLRCSQLHPIEVLPRVLYCYNQHGGSRVTKRGSGALVGLTGFLDKHESSMSHACRAYHRAVLAQLGGGREAMAKRLAEEAAASPIAASVAASAIGCWSVSSTIGIRRSDPALAARAMFRLIHRREPGHRRGDLVEGPA
jgi:GT2 family glycosyltransferase